MRSVVYLCLLLFASRVAAQSARNHPRDDTTIRQAKEILASSLDQGLPKVSLEFFLKYEAEGASIRWHVRDCGENDDSKGDTKGGPPDSSTCVEAEFDVNNRTVSVVVSTAASKAGLSGVPVLLSATMTDFAGTRHSIRHLGELPMMLHRPLRRMPRDVPDPGTSSGTV